MKACVIAVGSEMLTPFRVDTNSLSITERLNEIGCEVRLKVVVGDRPADLAAVLRAALEWADVIVTTGGLGPTEDDVTRDAVAAVLQRPLEEEAAIVARIRERFSRRGLAMPEINRRQAMVPRGATPLDNAHGTAPGLYLEHGPTAVVLLPGPAREMAPMFDAVVRARLAPRGGGAGVFRRVLKIVGRTESDVDACVQPIYSRWISQAVPIETTILAVMGQIELHLTARAGSRAGAGAALDPAVDALQAALGESVYSVDGSTLEEVVGRLLRARGLKIAVAESCTGGLLGSRLTDVPGSSAYVERGAVCYSNRAKTDWLGVPEHLIAEHGAVSEPVAAAMAAGVRAQASSEVGIGVTGIAGPGGGTAEKPVGTVAIAVLVEEDEQSRTFRFVGGRDLVKHQASQAALNMLRLLLTRRGRAWLRS
jgi:nicotinamide-nucleotide amidase